MWFRRNYSSNFIGFRRNHCIISGKEYSKDPFLDHHLFFLIHLLRHRAKSTKLRYKFESPSGFCVEAHFISSLVNDNIASTFPLFPDDATILWHSSDTCVLYNTIHICLVKLRKGFKPAKSVYFALVESHLWNCILGMLYPRVIQCCFLSAKNSNTSVNNFEPLFVKHEIHRTSHVCPPP